MRGAVSTLVMKTNTAAFLILGLAACAADNKDGELGETEQALSMQAATVTAAMTSASQPLGGFDIVGNEPITATSFDLHLEAQSKWQANVTTDLSWDGDKVRQGQTLDVKRTGSATGVIKVLWTLSGTIRAFDAVDINIPPTGLSLDITSCTPPLDGGNFTCHAKSSSITLFDGLVPLTPIVRFAIAVTFSGTGDAATATRTLLFDGDNDPSDDLSVTTDVASDPRAMPCNRPVGSTVEYALDPFHWAPANVIAVQQPEFELGMHEPFFDIPVVKFHEPFGPPITAVPEFALDGAGGSVALGDLQANNVLPTIEPLGPFGGSEGSPVGFSATATSACPITSYVWQFSNGTTSFGPTPQRTFDDDGVFDGQLVVTDSTHLSGSGSFTVQIANRPPVANAGPDTSGLWGTPIALVGQAVDPGADDQATLGYTWDFGDGTPGTGGSSVAHAYAAPGDYIAKLTVCDDHTCAVDTANVHVRARITHVAYTGANAGTFSAPVTLAGSVVDELGQPVGGGALAFTLAGSSAGAAQTNTAGDGQSTLDLALPAGSYPVAVSYPGSNLYTGGSAAAQLVVARMASALAYTGSSSGGANKTVNLSAKLVDALNRPLANEPVVFRLGSQQVSATTDATGIATAPLKLNQHNGQYPLTATWSPSGTETVRWTGTSTALTFTIGK
jgi:PKD repeat protein